MYPCKSGKILVSLVKFHPLIQEIWWIQTVTLMPAPRIRNDTIMSPLTFGGGGGIIIIIIIHVSCTDERMELKVSIFSFQYHLGLNFVCCGYN